VDGKVVKLLNQRNPQELPWRELGIDVVIEATGKFNAKEKASPFLKDTLFRKKSKNRGSGFVLPFSIICFHTQL
jgi:glyceraldehyde-3-phosphate dehydrogenase/erythrose-4-phosphate dehydrogenase